MKLADLHRIDALEEIAMLCYRWGLLDKGTQDGRRATRLYRLLMMVRHHVMGRKLCPSCYGELQQATIRAAERLGLKELSMRELRHRAGGRA